MTDIADQLIPSKARFKARDATRLGILCFAVSCAAACKDKGPISDEELPPIPNFYLVDGDNGVPGVSREKPSTYLVIDYKVTENSEKKRSNLTSTFPTYWAGNWSPSRLVLGGSLEEPGRGIFQASSVFEYSNEAWLSLVVRGDGVGRATPYNDDFTRFDVEEWPYENNNYFVQEKDREIAERLRDNQIPRIAATFSSSEDGKAEFDCETDLRSLNYAAPYDVITEEGIRWAQAKEQQGTQSFRIFVDYDNKTWSQSRPGRESLLPLDLDANGSVWDKIDAGSDGFICFKKFEFYSPEGWKTDCQKGLDLRNGQYRQIDLNFRFQENFWHDGRYYEGSRPVGYYRYGNEWKPGATNVEIGSCKMVEGS